MKISEITDNEDIEYIVIEVAGNISNYTNNAFISEGRWINSGKKDWMLRVDPKNPDIGLQRHVHIAKSKHINAKNMQASWNQDKTRHDKSTFNQKVASTAVVQQIAKQALNLDDDTLLEEIGSNSQLLLESHSQLVNTAPCNSYFLKATQKIV